MTTALLAEGLAKTYPGPPAVQAVAGIDLEVAEGEIFGLLGPNGAGKTTTVGMCTTRVVPSGGRVVVAGVDVTADPPGARRRIGVVTQFNTLDRSCTVAENVYFHCRYFGMSGPAARRRTRELLEVFRLDDRAHAMPDALSGGMAQRLQVARAVAHRPAVLFLDEPTAGLDPQSRIALWEQVGDLHREGTTVVLTTHYMEEADQLCDRLAIVDHGSVLVLDTPEELKRRSGGGTIVELQLGGDPHAALGALVTIEGVTRGDVAEGRVRLFVDALDGLLPRIVERCGPWSLHDVTVQEPSLETVFISLTGRALRD